MQTLFLSQSLGQIHNLKFQFSTIFCVLLYYVGESIIIRTTVINVISIKIETYNNIIFQHSPLAFQSTFSIFAQASFALRKKLFLAEQRATHATLPSVFGPYAEFGFKFE
jgi:hypothetical protein